LGWTQSDPKVARVEPPALGLGPEKVGAAAQPVRFAEAGRAFGGGGVVRAPAGAGRGPVQVAPTLRPRGASGPGPDAV
jgi:hypothetical protein